MLVHRFAVLGTKQVPQASEMQNVDHTKGKAGYPGDWLAMVNLKDACFQIPIWEGVAPLLDRRPWELLVCWHLLSHVQVALFHPFLQGLKIWVWPLRGPVC